MRISTVIPAYNRADLIGETLRSVLEQSRPPTEVIVVDDGSTDGTADAVAAYGKAVTLLRQANAGPASARNAGVAASTGEIVHFMDSDDLCSLNTYELHGAAIERGAEMVHGPWVKARIGGRMVRPEEFVLQQRPLPDRFVAADLVLLTHWATVLQACLFRREVIERAGPFRAELNPSDDLEMLYRILRLRPRIRHVAETLLFYRFHPEAQLTGADSPQRRADWIRVMRLFQRDAADRGDLAPQTRRLFKLERLDRALQGRDALPDDASELMRDTGPLDRVSLRALRLWGREAQKVRVRLGGLPYSEAFQPERMGARHAALIAELGYSLAIGDASANGGIP